MNIPYDAEYSIASDSDGICQTEPLHLPQARALVVDDSDLLRNLLSEILDSFGILADTATDGIEAVSKVKMNCYDIIFMDWNMPNMDGVSATKIIRQHFTHKRTPIIGVTANSSAAHRKVCLAAGMNELIAKPYLIADIKAAIGRWLSPRGVDRLGK